MTKKIGKRPGEGDEYGYFPDIFSVSVNRGLDRHRQKGAVIDDAVIKKLYDRASKIKARFYRRYGE